MTYEPKDFQAALEVTESHRDYWSDKTKKVIRHALTALSDPDWQLVPKAPTISMQQEVADWFWNKDDEPVQWGREKILSSDRYEQMLSAAPTYGDTDAKTE